VDISPDMHCYIPNGKKLAGISVLLRGTLKHYRFWRDSNCKLYLAKPPLKNIGYKVLKWPNNERIWQNKYVVDGIFCQNPKYFARQININSLTIQHDGLGSFKETISHLLKG
jgi:hypothetical protein